MSKKPLLALCCVLLSLGGCAQFDDLMSASAQDDNAATGAERSVRTDAPYINVDARPGTAHLRNVYIEPANLANMQVIQPEGASADGEWWVTDEEAAILQRTIAYEYTIALTFRSAFNIVTTPQQADLLISTAIVAVHPHESRASAARDGNSGGAITASVVVVNAATNAVLVRAVDTVPSDDIWAFNQVQRENESLSQVFRLWGENIRLGLLQLQGRSDDPALQ
ncbi:MAG: DUF3313 family protein [Halioglobus sp.]